MSYQHKLNQNDQLLCRLWNLINKPDKIDELLKHTFTKQPKFTPTSEFASIDVNRNFRTYYKFTPIGYTQLWEPIVINNTQPPKELKMQPKLQTKLMKPQRDWSILNLSYHEQELALANMLRKAPFKKCDCKKQVRFQLELKDVATQTPRPSPRCIPIRRRAFVPICTFDEDLATANMSPNEKRAQINDLRSKMDALTIQYRESPKEDTRKEIKRLIKQIDELEEILWKENYRAMSNGAPPMAFDYSITSPQPRMTRKQLYDAYFNRSRRARFHRISIPELKERIAQQTLKVNLLSTQLEIATHYEEEIFLYKRQQVRRAESSLKEDEVLLEILEEHNVTANMYNARKSSKVFKATTKPHPKVTPPATSDSGNTSDSSVEFISRNAVEKEQLTIAVLSAKKNLEDLQRKAEDTSRDYALPIKPISLIAQDEVRERDNNTPQDKLDDIPVSMVASTVQLAIAETSLFSFLGEESTLLVSAITSSVIATAASLHSLFTTELTTTSKILHAVSITTSLTTFGLSLGRCFKHFRVRSDIQRVMAQIPALTDSILNVETKANSLAWLYPSITALVSIIIGAVTKFDIMDIKSVIEKGRLLQASNGISTSVKGVAKFLLEDLAGLDVMGDQAAFAELHKWAKRTSEMAIKMPVEFLQDPCLHHELLTAVDVSLPIITRKYGNKDLSHAARSAYQLINTNLQTLLDKQAALEILLSAAKRIETIGVFFGGERGVGKSYLCEYVTRRISKVLNLVPKIYNLNKREDGFYGPYGGEPFGEINEFAALKSKDPNLPTLNQLISGDHYNLESAHLAGKQQPFKGRIVYLTCNHMSPDFNQVLEVEAARALWDRTLRFEIIDPLCQGRAGENTHRKPDFSHLKVRFVLNASETNQSNLRYKDIDVEEMLGIILIQSVKRELAFYKRSIDAGLITKEEIAYRTTYLEKITTANANCGTDFNVVRLQGPAGTGKTRLAHQIAGYIQGALPAWKTHKITQFDVEPTQKGIYVVDDLIEPSFDSYSRYLTWINAGHKDNLYIICSNHVYPIKTEYKYKVFPSHNYTELELHGVSNGICRRLGISGHIKCSDGTTYLSTTRSITVDQAKRGSFKINNEEVSLNSVKQFIFDSFTDYLKQKELITVRNESIDRRDIDYDCVIEANSYAQFNSLFKSTQAVMRARLGLTPGVSVFFKPSLVTDILRQFNSEDQLIPGKIENRDSLLVQAESIASILNTAVPGLSARLRLKDTGDDLVLHDRTLYVGVTTSSNDFVIQHDSRSQWITYTFLKKPYSISYKDYATFYATGVVPDSMKDTVPEVISLIHTYVKDNIGDPAMKYHSWYADVLLKKDEVKRKGIYQFIKDNPVLSIVTGVVALGSVGTVVMLMTKLFSNNKTVKSNSSDDENHTDPNVRPFIHRYQKALMQDRNAAMDIRKEAYAAGHKAKFDQWEHEWRSNSASIIKTQMPDAIQDGDCSKIVRLINYNPDEASNYFRTSSNMLSVKEDSTQPPSALEHLAERLRKNYVLCLSKAGQAYALMVTPTIGVTVAHIIDDKTTQFQIQSEGVCSVATVHKLSRLRDMLIFTLAKPLPFAADIRKLLPKKSMYYNLCDGWYVRPTSKPLFMKSPIEYIERRASPLRDPNNPYFKPESETWLFKLAGSTLNRQVFKLGDCGFPLMGCINDQWYLIGIHNAFGFLNKGWFVSLTTEDFDMVTSNSKPDKLAAKHILHPQLQEPMAIDDKLYGAVMHGFTQSRYQNCSKLNIYGYNEELNFHSYPKHKKFYVSEAEKYLTCETIGSAITTEHVEDFSKLVPDKRGDYNPLFTQATKYMDCKHLQAGFDVEIDKCTDHFLATYYRKNYYFDRELKLHEVINGFGNLRPIDMSTSTGPKFKKFFKIMTKRPLGNEDVIFKNESKTQTPWYVINTETAAGREVLNDYRFYKSMLKQGRPILTVVKDNAKVELLPVEKVKAGKVRLFNEMDMVINMVFKSYLGGPMERIIAKHDTHMFAIGMNPYLDATTHMLYFDMMPGDFLSSDFTALDKTTPQHMMKSFINCMLPETPKLERDALIKTLSYRLHTMNGHVYFIDCGNPSGFQGTTMLNGHTVAKTSLYTFVKRFIAEFERLPSYEEIEQNVILRILGDDSIRKYNQIFKTPITEEELVADARLYGLLQTKPKTDCDVSFCSRSYIPYNGIYLPQLKQSSITSCLFWFKSLQPEQVYQNCFTALMEAALHDEEFYDKISAACIALSRRFNFKFELASHALARACWVKYICRQSKSPVWGGQDPETQISEYINSNSRIHELQNNKTFIKMATLWLNEYVQKHRLEQPVYTYSVTGPDESLTWEVEMELETHFVEADGNKKKLTAIGSGTTKTEAKRAACENLKVVVENLNNVEIHVACYIHNGVEHHSEECQAQRDLKGRNVFYNHYRMERYLREHYPAMISYTFEAIQQLQKTQCLTAIDTAINGYLKTHVLPHVEREVAKAKQRYEETGEITPDDILKIAELTIEAEATEARANMGLLRSLFADNEKDKATSHMGGGDNSIEPATMNQAVQLNARANIPAGENPQPTAQNPAVTAPGDDIMAAVQIAQETTLTPIGAPNMLTVGSIGFDIKDVIYTQFMDCDVEFSSTESAPTGSIIVQIPYAVISPFTSAYIKAYAMLHKRYAGSIKYRVTCIGNIQLSGAIGVCWREQKWPGNTIPISETQLIAYGVKGVVNPWNEIHTLHDARKDQFYREVKDDTTESLDDRPHLIIFVNMNVFNPFRDSTLVRFRIASRLSNAAEPNTFFFALPDVGAIPQPSAPFTAALPAATVMPFDVMFPQCLNNKMHIYTDGTLRRGAKYGKGIHYPPYTGKIQQMAARRNIDYISNTAKPISTNAYEYLEGLGDQARYENVMNYWGTLSGNLQDYRYSVSVSTVATMSAQALATLMTRCPYRGMNPHSVGNASDAIWDQMRNTNYWIDRGDNMATPIEILAILYNNQYYQLQGQQVSQLGRVQMASVGSVKVITDQGTAVFHRLSGRANKDFVTEKRFEMSYGPNSILKTDPVTGLPLSTVQIEMPDWPQLNIDDNVGSLPSFNSLPLGLQAVRFTDMPPSSMTIDGYPGPTASDESIIERYFFERAKDLPITQCLEFSLVDTTSVRTICTVRYFQEVRLFVINAQTPNYRTLPIDTRDITVQAVLVIPRTNAFNETNTLDWFSRTGDLSTQAALAKLSVVVEPEEVTANAFLASMGAGMLQGIGQGINQGLERKHAEKMQGNQFSHESNLQSNLFGQQSRMQDNMFGHEVGMQGNMFSHESNMQASSQEFQNMMQNNRFGQEHSLLAMGANEQRTTNKMQSQNRMTERGLGARTQFLNESHA